MDVLVLNLAGPLQSWGVASHYKSRKTLAFPTLSGVTGLLASAMGFTREETARMGDIGLLDIDTTVRVDRKGVPLTDNQNLFYGDNKNKRAEKDYLQDAVFTVGVTLPPEYEDTSLLLALHQSLLSPVFPLFLGRKSCPPAGNVTLGVKSYIDREDFLVNEPLRPGTLNTKEVGETVRRKAYLSASEGFLVQDRPLDYSQSHRMYSHRTLQEKTVTLANPQYKSTPSFDPFELADTHASNSNHSQS